jgi:hypothetical protein
MISKYLFRKIKFTRITKPAANKSSNNPPSKKGSIKLNFERLRVQEKITVMIPNS